MGDFTENDLAAIERDRDINVPEPGDREADYWDTDEELDRISQYGRCHVCGRGRTITTTTSGRSTHTALVCPEGHDQP